MKVSRYPIVFNVDSVDLGGFLEQIDPAAVDRTLRNKADVAALYNHNSDMVLGRRGAGTLALEKHPRGLLASVDVNQATSFGADFLGVVGRNDAPGGSFGFRAIADDWTMVDGIARRRVLDMQLREISLAVAFPAYPDTMRDDGGRAAARMSLAMRMRYVRQWKAASR